MSRIEGDFNPRWSNVEAGDDEDLDQGEKNTTIDFGSSLQHSNLKNQLYRNSLLHQRGYDSFIAPGLDNNMQNPVRRSPEMRNPNTQMPAFHN